MNDRRVFIANLAKGKLSAEKSNLLGSLLATQFQLAAMSRAARPETERQDFFLFIDEFQNFTTDVFASILSEARKYRLCLTLSHQYVQQLPAVIQQAVFGNVGTLIAFRVGHVDADSLAKEFGQNIYAGAVRRLEPIRGICALNTKWQNRCAVPCSHVAADRKPGRAERKTDCAFT